jgi:hypothetical protein
MTRLEFEEELETMGLPNPIRATRDQMLFPSAKTTQCIVLREKAIAVAYCEGKISEDTAVELLVETRKLISADTARNWLLERRVAA